MRTEALRLVGGVLALRRFTVAELMAFSRVKRSTASSWLNRNSELFDRDRWRRPGGRGRPDTVFVLKSDCASGLEDILSKIPSPALEKAYDPERRGHRLVALDRAAKILTMLTDDRDAKGRESAVEWFSTWVSAARRQADDVSSTGTEVDVRDADRLMQFEVFARALSSSTPTILNAGEWVLESARHCMALVADAEWSSLGRQAFERSVAQDILNSDGPLGLVAALGIMSKMPILRQARITMCRLAGSVTPERYVSSVKGVFEAAEAGRVDERALVAVLVGARRQEVLGSDASFATWIGHVAAHGSWSAPVLGAMLMIHADGPGGRLSWIVDSTDTPSDGATLNAWYRLQTTSADTFDRAVAEVARHSAEYGVQLRSSMRRSAGFRTGIERFVSLFAPGDTTQPDPT